MPSTMIIMPAIKMIVAQLIPLEDSSASFAYQKPTVKMFFTLRVSITASHECIPKPNTKSSVKAPQTKVIHWRSKISRMIITNITQKIETAKI